MSDPNIPQTGPNPPDPAIPVPEHSQPGFEAPPPGYDPPQQPFQAPQPPQHEQQNPYGDPAAPPYGGPPPAQAYPMPPYDATGAFVPPAAPPPSPPPAGYASPEYGYQPTAPYIAAPAPSYGYQGRTNTLAIVSLVLALAGIPGVLLSFFDVAVLGAAVVCGHIAQNQLRHTATTTGVMEKGKGMALAGLIIGYSLIGLGVLFWIVFFIVMGTTSSLSD